MRFRATLALLVAPLLLGAAPAMSEFSLETVDGRILDSHELRGKVVLIDVWGTWCGPCKAAAPALDRIYSDLRDRGLEMMGIAVRSGSADEVARAAKEMGMSYPVALWNRDLQETLGGTIESLPTYILVAPDWTIAATFVGATSPRVLREYVEKLLPAQ